MIVSLDMLKYVVVQHDGQTDVVVSSHRCLGRATSGEQAAAQRARTDDNICIYIYIYIYIYYDPFSRRRGGEGMIIYVYIYIYI